MGNIDSYTGDYSDSLLIIDVQDGFLPFEFSYEMGSYLQARSRLISNIIARGNAYLKKGKKVYLVEFLNAGNTVKAISECLGGAPGKIYKTTMDIADHENPHRNSAIEELQRNGDSIELSGIHATSCVMHSCCGLTRLGFKVSVNITNILNGHLSRVGLFEMNKVSFIHNRYRNHYDKNEQKVIDISGCLSVGGLQTSSYDNELVWNK